MKILLLAASLSLALLSPLALAQPKHGGGHGQSNDQGEGDHGHHGNRGGDHDRGNRDGDDRGHRYAYGHRYHHDNGRHLGQYKFARGQRVPTIYMQPRYYVEDYRVYNLAPPPRGYRWVRPDDGRYLLISTATGLISQILGY
jgi:Ni/Co efflux regulator RcnB